MDRRQFLRATALAGAAVPLLGACTPQPTTFAPAGLQPLPIPALVDGKLKDGARHFELRVQAGTSALIAGRADLLSQTYGYNGAQLGPTLRMRRGEPVVVAAVNELREVTTLHWHGMHLPALMDGGPHTAIAAGGQRRVEWTVQQPAATLWYHPHPHGQTQLQVLRGLAGMVLLEDDVPHGLPQEYGVSDVPLILQDKFLDGAGQIQVVDGGGALGTVGPTLVVNGLSGTYFEVGDELVRLRILNGASGRIFDLRFSDERPFDLVGSDGGLLVEPVRLQSLVLTPGERAEVLVRFSPGERVLLRTHTPQLEGVSESLLADMTAGDLVEFRAQPQLRAAQPGNLPPPQREALLEAQAREHRSFEMRLRFLNGNRMDLTRVDAIVRVGTTELWEIHTPDVYPHNFHVHDVQFQVLSIDGEPPPPTLRGWKDTIPVLPGQVTKILLRFEDYVDEQIPYMMHCHLLQHEDAGMMGQFLVTADGQGPSRLSAPPHDGHDR